MLLLFVVLVAGELPHDPQTQSALNPSGVGSLTSAHSLHAHWIEEAKGSAAGAWSNETRPCCNIHYPRLASNGS
jgi:hypothetical protein